jgi:hypothetical protein
LQQTVRLTLYSVGSRNEWTWISENIPAFKPISEAAYGSFMLPRDSHTDVAVPPTMFDFIMSTPGKYRLQFDFVSPDNSSNLDKNTWKGVIIPPGVEFEVR